MSNRIQFDIYTTCFDNLLPLDTNSKVKASPILLIIGLQQ